MSQTFQQIRERAGELAVFPVEVTPELASELLTLNQSNRPLRKGLVRQYAAQMKKGNWRFNGDVIRLCKNGTLYDGQHRLTAIIESEVPQIFNVQTGLEEETFAVMDIGKNRTAADTLSIEGYMSTAALAGAIRLVIYYDTGILASTVDAGKRGANSGIRITTQDILNWMKENGSAEITEALGIAQNLYSKNHLLTQSRCAAFLYLFSRLSVDKARYFMESLITGRDISHPDNHAIYLLRERLIQWSIRRTVTPQEQYAVIIKGWNAWVTSKPVKRLTFKAGEEFPKIV